MLVSVKKKLLCSFFGNVIIKPERLNYYISLDLDFHATFAAAGAAMSRSVKENLKEKGATL